MSRFHSTHCFRPTTYPAKAPRGATIFVCLGLAATALLGAVSAHAQESGSAHEPRFYGGVRLAFSMGDVKAQQEYDPRFGVGGGGFVGMNAWKQVGLRLEANYTQKGADLAFSRSSIEWQMDYIEMPLLLVLNLAPKSKTSVEMCVGFFYAFPLQRQVEVGNNLGYDLVDYVGQEIYVNQTTNIRINSVEDFDMGFTLGLGLNVPIGVADFLVDVRYSTSLTDPVVDADFLMTTGEGTEAVTTTNSADFANRCFTFYFGFAFPFGSRSNAGSE